MTLSRRDFRVASGATVAGAVGGGPVGAVPPVLVPPVQNGANDR